MVNEAVRSENIECELIGMRPAFAIPFLADYC